MAENEDFDPYKAREVKHPVSNFGTMLHFLKGSVGTGILAMPRAFVYTGMLLGTIATFVTGCICSYGLNLLMHTEYQLCKRKRVPHLTYSEAMQYAMENGPTGLRCLAKPAGIMVDVFLVSYQLGICCVYMIFVSANVKTCVDMAIGKESYDIKIYMCIFFVLFLLINFVPNLQVMAPLSGVANAIMIIGLAIILYFVFSKVPPEDQRSLFGKPSKWIMFIGICLFAIESVGVVVSAELHMERPQDFGGLTGVLNISLMIVTFLYWFIGFFGYWAYGDCSKGTMTLNLPSEDWKANTTQILFSIALIISYGLQCYPAIEIGWDTYLLPRFQKLTPRRQLGYQYLLRIGLTLMTFVLALTFAKHLATAISFIGVVCLSMLGFAFPGLMNLCYLWPDGYGKWQWKKLKNLLLFGIGIFLLISGFYVTIVDILYQEDFCVDKDVASTVSGSPYNMTIPPPAPTQSS